jgi:hypothetical protein
MEVIPKAIYNRKTAEAEFYELFFGAVTYWANDIEKVIQEAYQIASSVWFRQLWTRFM